jgi:acyl-CoA thioester hydrolase
VDLLPDPPPLSLAVEFKVKRGRHFIGVSLSWSIMERMNPAAEVYELEIAVEPSDIDQLGHVNNVTYVRWVQDAATAHWSARATAEDQERILWVVVRHEIDYKQSAQLGDKILARTWVGTATRATFERFTEFRRVSDGVLLAKARTLWCPIDAQTHRPVRVSPAVREVFSAVSVTAKD